MINNRCLHVEANALIRGHNLPYCAHIRTNLPTGVEEVVESVHIQFDHDRCTPRAQEWLGRLDDDEEQALFEAVSHEALSIYNMKRLRGEQIEGEDRPS